MAQTQSSLRGRSTPNAGNQPCGTAYASAATREGESLMLLETASVMDPNSRIKSRYRQDDQRRQVHCRLAKRELKEFQRYWFCFTIVLPSTSLHPTPLERR
jgi:hypothetical protein